MAPVADLSIVMPTYNDARRLPHALQAIVAQSVLPRELIVVDDASTDETPALLEEFAQRCSFLRVVRNERNLGVNRTIQRGFGETIGRYVYFPASDDQVLPRFVEKSLGILERHPEAGLCCSFHSTVIAATGEVRPNPTGWCSAPRYFPPLEAERLLGHASIPGHTAIMKRSAYLAAGGLMSELRWYSDWFVTLVIAFREGMCHVPESLALLTVDPRSYSANPQGSPEQQAALNVVFDKLLSPSYSDVAPAFRRSGVMSIFGSAMFRAAARRPDAWTAEILGLINCLTDEQYENLLGDAEPAVRQLAALFAGPFADEARRERQRLVELERHCRHLDESIGRMKSSAFWRLRSFLGRCKRAVLSGLRINRRQAAL